MSSQALNCGLPNGASSRFHETEAAPPRAAGVYRRVALVVHRYAGLAMAVFLVVAGLTGSVIAFHDELDAGLNPALYDVRPPGGGARPLDVFSLRDRLQSSLPEQARVSYVPLEEKAGESVIAVVAVDMVHVPVVQVVGMPLVPDGGVTAPLTVRVRVSVVFGAAHLVPFRLGVSASS